MSVITGLWLKDGEKVDSEALSALGDQTKRYAPDGGTTFANGSVWMMYQALHTHERSFSATSVFRGSLGTVLALDGRIDNYEELCHKLDLNPHQTSDEELILAAYLKHGSESLAQLVGDWSLSIWDESKKTLCLARDHAGTRTLYYADTPKFTMWSTFPEAILAYTGAQELDREYVERYLAAASTGDLTPYAGIKAVPAGCYLLISRSGNIRRVEHWSPLVKEKLGYQRDEDYQEEFLSLFCQAVKRRTGGKGVFAHLSGGVDSSSIVCVADLIAAREGKAPSLRTVSFFDDQEPDWNERPYFTAVEEYRGIRGVHFHASAADRDFLPPPEFPPLPGADKAFHEREKKFSQLPTMSDCRVILAGHGGDELLGGPPDPRPELADALVSLSFRQFFDLSFAWALSKRMPLILVASDAVRFTSRCYPSFSEAPVAYPPWLWPKNAKTAELSVDKSSTVGFSPSAIGLAADWRRLLETLPHRYHGLYTRHEHRYPFLDRDLVDFLLRVPPRQLVRPARRRFMMRAALRCIVPEEVLERKRKGFVSRGPRVALEKALPWVCHLIPDGLLAEMRVVDAARAVHLLRRPMTEGTELALPLIRLIDIEIWVGEALRRRAIVHPLLIAV